MYISLVQPSVSLVMIIIFIIVQFNVRSVAFKIEKNTTRKPANEDNQMVSV